MGTLCQSVQKFLNQVISKRLLMPQMQLATTDFRNNHKGHVVPDAFTHGTSAQRMYWFKKGFESGDPQKETPSTTPPIKLNLVSLLGELTALREGELNQIL